jgi:hypothetical protein
VQSVKALASVECGAAAGLAQHEHQAIRRHNLCDLRSACLHYHAMMLACQHCTSGPKYGNSMQVAFIGAVIMRTCRTNVVVCRGSKLSYSPCRSMSLYGRPASVLCCREHLRPALRPSCRLRALDATLHVLSVHRTRFLLACTLREPAAPAAKALQPVCLTVSCMHVDAGQHLA